MIGRMADIERLTGNGFGISGFLMFCLAPVSMPFYLGGK